MKLKIKKERQIWFFSDPHYNHNNICRGTTNWRTKDGQVPTENTRDFESIEKMNAAIVNNINAVVNQDDILICLGDWSFGGFDSIAEFHNRLVCKNIHLVLGNHDDHIEKNKSDIQRLFLTVNSYVELEFDNNKFVLCHYPIASWNGLNKGVIHLHGHCHLPTNKRLGKGKRMDVGMDGHPEFRPYNLKEVLSILNKQPIASDMGFDHHTEELLNVVG
jgi:calcineurin-like phosphoesterase family protein